MKKIDYGLFWRTTHDVTISVSATQINIIMWAGLNWLPNHRFTPSSYAMNLSLFQVRNAVPGPNNLPRCICHLHTDRCLNAHCNGRPLENCGQPNHSFPPQVEH
jgi:hypothetical protein